MYVQIKSGGYAPNSFPHLYQGQTEPFKVGREFAAQVVCKVSPESEPINLSGHFFSSSLSTCGCICMFSLSCSSGYMSDLLVPFINKCNTKLCFKYIELLFLECEIIFREKKWQEWLQQNLNDRVLICINCLESFVEPGNRAK